MDNRQLDITRQTGKIEDNAYKFEEQDVDIKLEENETKVEMKKECNEIEIDGRNGDFEKDALDNQHANINVLSQKTNPIFDNKIEKDHMILIKKEENDGICEDYSEFYKHLIPTENMKKEESNEETTENGKFDIHDFLNVQIEVMNDDDALKNAYTSFECDFCMKVFSCESMMAKHRKIHTLARPFTCDICQKAFTRRDSLYKHKRTHTGMKPHTCVVCSKSFARKENLIVHERTHTGEKPFQCEVCNKSFATKGNLMNHRRTHTGERPFICEFCNKSYTWQTDLIAHRKTHAKDKVMRNIKSIL